MKRHCKNVKKIMRMKWRSLNFTKSVTRRIGRFYNLKYYLIQMNLKNYQNLLMILTRKNRSLKKHHSMEKKTATKRGKKVKKTLQPKKTLKSPEFVDTGSDDTEDEQEPSLKKPNDYKGLLCLGLKKNSKVFLIFRRRLKI